MEKLEPDVAVMLNKVANKDKMSTLSYEVEEKTKSESGYLGTMYYVIIHYDEKHIERYVVIKKALEKQKIRRNFPISRIFQNECLFYNKIWPTLLSFQELYYGTGKARFNKIPTCHVVSEKHDQLVLENLKYKNFKPAERRLFYDKEHLELILKEYGKFHGVSMAYKLKFNKQFKYYTAKMYDFWKDINKLPAMKVYLEITMHQCYAYLVSESKKGPMIGFLKYAQDLEKSMRPTRYCDDYSVILHGDCWSHNIMLKYNDSGKPIDLRLIDFQFAYVGTPVYDLSYLIYSGGTKEIFDELDHYLEVYHESLRNTLRKYECDPDTYPFHMLKYEWTRYSNFGFVMGLVLIKEKFMYENKEMTLSEIIDNIDNLKDFDKTRFDIEEVKKKSLELIDHRFKMAIM
nr:uncharacterized protein LOC111512548 [Leptinotarsa decemlineata]